MVLVDTLLSKVTLRARVIGVPTGAEIACVLCEKRTESKEMGEEMS